MEVTLHEDGMMEGGLHHANVFRLYTVLSSKESLTHAHMYLRTYYACWLNNALVMIEKWCLCCHDGAAPGMLLGKVIKEFRHNPITHRDTVTHTSADHDLIKFPPY